MKLAAAPETYQQTDQAQMRRELLQADAQNFKRGVALDALYLTATDDGSTMKGTVDSAGTWTWVRVSRT